ncbi:MAG: transglutaminase family protein [Candidatus Thorarchaeota archaeon]
MKIEHNQEEEGLDRYLECTELCDWDNPEVMRASEDITKGTASPEEAALKIFYFVRDEIAFSISDSRTRASQTLKRRAGECGTKTNLHIALLRASGIPARFHVSRCRSEALEGVIPNWLLTRMPQVASHFWPEVYVLGRWVACEGLFDKRLYQALLSRGNIDRQQIPTIEWDGNTDLILLKHWIVEDLGILNSFDDVYEMLDRRRKEEGMPPRTVERLFGWLIYSSFRRHTDRVRRGQSDKD